MDNTGIIEEEKKPPEWRKPFILAIVTVAILLLGMLIYACSIRKTFSGFMVESENAVALALLKASNQQVEDYWKANGTAVLADGEYYVRCTSGGDDWVNEPCELLPESAVNKYYSGDNRKRYAVVKFKNGKAVEAWQSCDHELEDDELRQYERRAQQEKLNKHLIKSVRVVVGYYNAEQGDTYFH